MRGSGHHATGFISGFLAASFLYKVSGSPLILSFIAVPFAWWGGLFPDSSEFLLGVRWVRHRTVTHWVPLWVLALLAAIGFPFGEGLVAIATQAAMVGFTVGGLTHLLFDWPNPRGIPFLTPWRHHSLDLWNSGKREIYLVLVWALIAVVAWAPEVHGLVLGYQEMSDPISSLVEQVQVRSRL